MLAKSGSLKASELARLCDISRMEAYRILRRLEDKGIVEAVMGRPMKFQSIPPEKAFDTLLKSGSEKLLSMKSEKNYLLSLWPSQHFFEEEKKEGDKFRIIQGRAEFNNTFRRALHSAHKEVLIITSKNGLSRLFHTGFDKDFKEQTDKGISIRILSPVCEGETEAVDEFSSITNLRYLNNPFNSQIILIDGLNAIVSTSLDDSMSLTSDKDTSIWTNSKDHFTPLELLFEELWNNSLELKLVSAAIENGEKLPRFQRIVGREKIIQIINESLTSAINQIIILSPSLTNSILFNDETLTHLRNAINNGLKVKILTELEKEDAAIIDKYKDEFEIRITNTHYPLDILLSDESNLIKIKTSSTVYSKMNQESINVLEKDYNSIIGNFLYDLWEKGENAESILKSMDWIEHLQIILKKTCEELNNKGYYSENPGIIEGSSTIKYSFDLVARNKDNTKKAIVNRYKSNEDLIPFYAKVKDCGIDKPILLVDSDFPEDSIKLGSFYGISIIRFTLTDNNIDKIVNAIIAILNTT
jgi:sugar-specific transcriptional regulator TrmB